MSGNCQPMECCVIVPCYNESGRILTEEFVGFVQDNPSFRFLFVNDGSTDHTADVLAGLERRHNRLHALQLAVNRGKASAVREGLLHAAGRFDSEFFAFLDADLAIPLDELQRLFALTVSGPDLLFTFMSKVPRKGAVDQPLRRFAMGRALAAMTRLSLRLQVYDTQCGCKIMARELVPVLAGEDFISPWLFDIEMFHRLVRANGRDWFAKHAREVPLQRLIERGGSRVSGRHLFRLPLELWTIHRTYSSSR
jgi:dolichyl-phosphate beta-glucosyltransferase